MDYENYILKKFWKWRNVNAVTPAQANKKVGNLAYTTGGFIATILLLLMGAFGFSLIIGLVGTVLPRQLDKVNASNTIIALVITTMPYAVTTVVNPIVSVMSDKLRSRMGRRIPFVLFSAPIIGLLLIGIGWSSQIASFIMTRFGVENNYVPLIVLSAFAILYQFVFMIPGAVFWYLFPDVVPENFISRFMALFQVVGSGASFLFSNWLLKFAENYTNYLYTVIGVFYILVMVIMCLCVKEGEHPIAKTEKRKNILEVIITYIKECYSIPFYYGFFVTIALSEVSLVCRNMYNLLYAEKTLGIPIESFGSIMGYYALIGLVLSVPLSYIADKIHPMRMYGLGLILVVLVNVFSFFMVKDEKTFMISTILLGVVYTVQMVSTIPIHVVILPKESYGQFCSANALFRALFMAVIGLGGGLFFDWVKDYQYIYAWDFVFTLTALFSFTILYINWMRRGGKNGYVAPVTN